jgi:hypothetical protein
LHRFVGLQGAANLHLCTECAVADAEAHAYACQDREESLTTIRVTARALVADGFSPPEPFLWMHQTEYRWWAFAGFGRYGVALPLKRGWLVGDYPWEGMVNRGARTSVNEVFVRPTYVDARGGIAPRDALRSTPIDDDLFTDEMCHEIADTMQQIAFDTREAARQPD